MADLHRNPALDDPEGPMTHRRLRIAVVTESWPPEINGVATTIARVVEGLATRGHGIQLVRPRQRGGDDASPVSDLQQVLTRGVPIPRYPHLTMGLPARRTLIDAWRHQRPDIVHIATEGPLGWSALRAARALDLPVSSDFRTNFQAYSRHYGIGWLNAPIVGYLRGFHNAAQATMVPTRALADELRSQGFRNLQVVGRGVDTERFTPAKRSTSLRATWGADDGVPVVGCVGRLAAEKNLELTIDAYRAIRHRRPDALLLFIGDGPMRTALQSACPDALFAGSRRGDDLATHYASLDALLFPSRTETFGNVTIEAMASGLPVVAFELAAASQLIRSGINGLAAPAADAPRFIDHAVRLALNPTFARALGTQARADVQPHSWSSILDQVERVMRNSIRRHNVAVAAPPWRGVKPSPGSPTLNT